MKTKGIYIFFFSILFLATPLLSQQLPTFLNYSNNWQLLNPAATNPDFLRDDYYTTALAANYRKQWSGIEAAPTTQSLLYSWMPESLQFHTGLQLLNDKTGVLGLSGVYGQFAYRIPFNRKHFLSIGLNAGLVQYRTKTSQVRLLDANDILGADANKIYPDFGLGIYYQYDDWFYAGVSVPQVFGLQTAFGAGQQTYELTRLRHYYAQTRINWYQNRSKSSYFSLSAWGKYLPNVPLTFDANIRYYFQDIFWLGLGGSTAEIAHLEVGCIIGEGLGYLDGLMHVGFGYDYSLSAASNLLGNTLELSVRYSW